MPPSELTPNYRADNNRGAQRAGCAAVCSRRKSGCRIAVSRCHAPFCRPRIILRALVVIQPTLAPLCPDYRKLSTIIPRVSMCMAPPRMSHDRASIQFQDVRYYVTRREMSPVGPGRECYWRKISSRIELRVKILLSFPFSSLHALGLLLSDLAILNNDS